MAGNMDDPEEIKRTIDTERLVAVYFHQLTGTLRLDSKRIAFTHKPRDAEVLLKEDFDIIFYGHTHDARIERRGKALLVNPGDVEGRFVRSPSYAMFDTRSGKAVLHPVS